ncbi:hypothetical protein N9W89_14655, partial [Hellea sp.]|nr:hypothetical protein [Hellea sp.]
THSTSLEALRKGRSAKTILKAASQEINQLHALVERLQCMTQIQSGFEDTLSASENTALQSLDYITQSLFVLSDVLGDAAHYASSDWLIDDLKSIEESKLKTLKDRFNGIEVPLMTLASTGKCDFF